MKMIAAVSKSWGIGRDNGLLFHIPADMKFFRETTMGCAVVMGRKTLDSFPNGAPLKNRVNIVLTQDTDFSRESVIVCHTKEEVLAKAKEFPEVFIIGGEMVYRLFLQDCDTAYITKVDADTQADKYIDDLDKDPQWYLTEESEVLEDNGYTFTFCKYTKR